MIEGGFGGSHTKSGAKFKKSTNLPQFLQAHCVLKNLTIPTYKNRRLNQSYKVYDEHFEKLIGYATRKRQFYIVAKELFDLDMSKNDIKSWEPDEAFYNIYTNTWYIVEKKFQKTKGSVDEKILGFVEKTKEYRQMFAYLDHQERPKFQFIAMLNEEFWRRPENYSSYGHSFKNLETGGTQIIFDTYHYGDFGIQIFTDGDIQAAIENLNQ